MPIVFLISLFKRGHFLRRRLLGSLRAGAYLCVLALAGTVFGVSRARAQLREQSMALGKELAPVADLLKGATALRLNGQILNLSVTVAGRASVREVLDRFQTQCEAHPGPLAREARALAARVPKVLQSAPVVENLLLQLAMARQDGETEGSLLCFTGDHPQEPHDFVERFEKSSDLAELGRLRYVLVNREGDPEKEPDLTRVTALWTEDSFRLESLEPPLFGDAPGSDLAFVPRPPASTRIFSAEAVGSAYSVRVYETDLAGEKVLAFYDAAMAGWSRLTVKSYDDRGRAYMKDSKPLLVQVSRDESKTLVTLSEVGGRAELEKLVR